MKQQSCPVVGIPCDAFNRGVHSFHGVGEKYIHAVIHGLNARPVLIPAGWGEESMEALAELYSVNDLLKSVNGLLLTGSPSNVEPHHYHENSFPGLEYDPQRDSITLPLIRGAIEQNIPVLAICRGFQELNVALGGSLYQHLQEVPGMMNHEKDPNLPMDERYGYAHDVILEPDGLLMQLTDTEREGVNSLHIQGINRLADGLEIEARAPDGLIEAVRYADSSRFLVGVQWHPEWHFQSKAFYQGLFGVFQKAIQERL